MFLPAARSPKLGACCDDCAPPRTLSGLGVLVPEGQGCTPGWLPSGNLAPSGFIECIADPTYRAATFAPHEAPAAPAPAPVTVTSTVSPVTQIQVSPQISPVFQQSSGSGAQSAGTTQTTRAPQSSGVDTAAQQAMLQKFLEAQQAREDALQQALLQQQQAQAQAQAAAAAPAPQVVTAAPAPSAGPLPEAKPAPAPAAPMPQSSGLMIGLAMALLGGGVLFLASRRR